MKKTVLIIFMLIISGAAMAQRENMKVKNAGITSGFPVQFGFGPRFAGTYSNLVGSDGTSREGLIGLSYGGSIDMQFSKNWLLSLDIVYSSQGYKVKDVKEKQVTFNIQTPILLNYLVTPKLAIKAGVQPSYLSQANRHTTEKREVTTDEWRRYDISIPVGVGYMITRNMELDLRYNIGLTNIDATKKNNRRNSVIVLGYSYKFRRK